MLQRNLLFLLFLGAASLVAAPKKIYFSFTMHGNMNYDRYPKTTIWEKFPETYENVVDFISEHPDFKGQLQLSGQTFKSLQQTSPRFIEKALNLYRRNQIDFTGTFYSEPVNVCMDGESNLLAASLGTAIVRTELAPPSGFFLQEYAWNPQLPWILTKAGVDWVPVRVTENRRFNPFYAVGLDGTKIPAVQEWRDTVENLVTQAPEDALFMISGDYEKPGRMLQTYEDSKTYQAAHPEVSIEWIRVRDYLAQHPITEEDFIDNARLIGTVNWDSYSRWTADPLDIIVHTATKKAEAALRAAKIAAAAAPVFAAAQGLTGTATPDIPADSIQTYITDRGVDWDIEHAATYPDVEPRYLTRNGQVTLLSRAEHLLAWAVNSDARGWWPLPERREERIKSFQYIRNLADEIMMRALEPLGSAVPMPDACVRTMLVYNAEKARTAVLSLETARPYRVVQSGNTACQSRTFRQGTAFHTRVALDVPAYGYAVIGLAEGGSVQTPQWRNGTEIRNDRFVLTAGQDRLRIQSGNRSLVLSLDPFQVRIMAETVIPTYSDLEGWHDAKPYGPARVSVCSDDLYPRLRIDRQVDWYVHLRQDYELRPDHVACTWTFTCLHPTLIRRNGIVKGPGWEQQPPYAALGEYFRPEGLMARLETGEAGVTIYDVPYGIATHKVTGPSYICAQNFALLQQQGYGVMVSTRTGTQAIGVDPDKGSLALCLGASTPSGPVRNPYLKVNGLKPEHEEPFYSEFFHGEYVHEFMVYPFNGQWEDNAVSSRARSFANDVYTFELPSGNRDGVKMPTRASFLTLEPAHLEITTLEQKPEGLLARLNERSRQAASGVIRIGATEGIFMAQPNGIIELMLK